METQDLYYNRSRIDYVYATDWRFISDKTRYINIYIQFLNLFLYNFKLRISMFNYFFEKILLQILCIQIDFLYHLNFCWNLDKNYKENRVLYLQFSRLLSGFKIIMIITNMWKNYWNSIRYVTKIKQKKFYQNIFVLYKIICRTWFSCCTIIEVECVDFVFKIL